MSGLGMPSLFREKAGEKKSKGGPKDNFQKFSAKNQTGEYYI